MASYTTAANPIVTVPKSGPDQGIWVNLQQFTMQAAPTGGYFLDSEHYQVLRSENSPLRPFLPRTIRRSDNSEVHYQLFENEDTQAGAAGTERCSSSRPINERGLSAQQIEELASAVTQFKEQHKKAFDAFTLPNYTTSSECYRVDQSGRLLILWGIRKSTDPGGGMSAQNLVNALQTDKRALGTRDREAGKTGAGGLWWWLLPLLLLLLLAAFLFGKNLLEPSPPADSLPVATVVQPSVRSDSQQFLTVEYSPENGIAPVLIRAQALKPGEISIGDLSKQAEAGEWLSAPPFSVPGRVRVNWQPRDSALNGEFKDVEVKPGGQPEAAPAPEERFGIQVLNREPAPGPGLTRVRLLAVNHPAAEELDSHQWAAIYEFKKQATASTGQEAIFDLSPGDWTIVVTAKRPNGKQVEAEKVLSISPNDSKLPSSAAPQESGSSPMAQNEVSMEERTEPQTGRDGTAATEPGAPTGDHSVGGNPNLSDQDQPFSPINTGALPPSANPGEQGPTKPSSTPMSPNDLTDGTKEAKVPQGNDAMSDPAPPNRDTPSEGSSPQQMAAEPSDSKPAQTSDEEATPGRLTPAPATGSEAMSSPSESPNPSGDSSPPAGSRPNDDEKPSVPAAPPRTVDTGINWNGTGQVNPDGSITFVVKGTRISNGKSTPILNGRLYVGPEKERRTPNSDGSFEIQVPRGFDKPIEVIGETEEGARIPFTLNPSASSPSP